MRNWLWTLSHADFRRFRMAQTRGWPFAKARPGFWHGGRPQFWHLASKLRPSKPHFRLPNFSRVARVESEKNTRHGYIVLGATKTTNTSTPNPPPLIFLRSSAYKLTNLSSDFWWLPGLPARRLHFLLAQVTEPATVRLFATLLALSKASSMCSTRFCAWPMGFATSCLADCTFQLGPRERPLMDPCHELDL